jgi:hypothetical protein
VVKDEKQADARSLIRRVAYSTAALTVIGGAVAVLGAPVKWSW